jgi:iron-sulfur cluster insertion protein
MSLTESAAQKLRALRTEEGNDNLKLRVYITGGGCAGFSYGFKFDEVVNEGDTSVLRDDVTMVVDELSIQYLAGSTVDYVEGLQGARFVIANPNASSTCGCGSSFSV